MKIEIVFIVVLQVFGLNWNDLSLKGEKNVLKSQLCAYLLPALGQEATPYLIFQIYPKVILSMF